MTTSGTFNFAPSLGELVLYAFALCGIRRTEILNEHMVNARMAANLMLVDLANEGPNLWEVDLQTVNLVQGTATYSVPAETITILDAYIDNSGGAFDRYITPISRTEYAQYPNKTQQGAPTVYWYDRLRSPSITLWQVPDNNGPYVLSYYRFRQTQDANYAGGQQPEIPWRFLSWLAYGLASHLALIYAPALATGLTAVAASKQEKAFTQDTENVPLFIMPGLDSYYR